MDTFAFVKYVSKKNSNNKRKAVMLQEKISTLNCYLTYYQLCTKFMEKKVEGNTMLEASGCWDYRRFLFP